jgi:hypothetical protein
MPRARISGFSSYQCKIKKQVVSVEGFNCTLNDEVCLCTVHIGHIVRLHHCRRHQKNYVSETSRPNNFSQKPCLPTCCEIYVELSKGTDQ